jgi:hypothetical protein
MPSLSIIKPNKIRSDQITPLKLKLKLKKEKIKSNIAHFLKFKTLEI